jgi:hypothetical protein
MPTNVRFWGFRGGALILQGFSIFNFSTPKRTPSRAASIELTAGDCAEQSPALTVVRQCRICRHAHGNPDADVSG